VLSVRNDIMNPALTVYVRIALYILAGRLMAGGWIPEDVKLMLVSPEMVETTTGILLGAITIAWYHYSRARNAIVRLVKSSAGAR